MITLLTGLPGHGKGVYGIDFVINDLEDSAKAKAKETGKSIDECRRPVYYHGITDCKIPNWIHLDDPEKWYDCPVGSFIFIDECQQTFRVRSAGSKVPEHVSRLEKHRHQGFDLFLVTQHPMLVDGNLRRLVDRHFHIVRKFGTEKATVHEWNSVNEQCGKVRKDSIRHEYSYNKNIYQLYKSAEVHTVKKRVPMRVYIMYTLPFVILALFYYAYVTLMSRSDVSTTPDLTSKSETSFASKGSLNRDKPKTLAEYINERKPRIPDIPSSAPIYDDLSKPTESPKIAACIKSKSFGCRCYSQQATILRVSANMCEQVIDTGFFDSTRTVIASQSRSKR